MTILFFDPLFQRHDTGRHPEQPARLVVIQNRLENAGLVAQCKKGIYQPLPIEDLQDVHTPEVVAKTRRLAEAGGGWLEADTFVCPESFQVALAAAGADRRGRSGPGRQRTHRPLPGSPAGASRHRPQEHGLLPLQQYRPRRPARPQDVRPGSHSHRRLGCPPRQRHPGHLLGRPDRLLSQSASFRPGLLPGHGNRGRNRHSPRPRLHGQCADPFWHASDRLSRLVPQCHRKRCRQDQTRSRPAQRRLRRATGATRSARSAWRRRISPT